MTNIVKVPFHGDEVTALDTADGIFVAVRPICDRLGLAWKPQFVKLTSEKQRWSVTMMVTETAAGERESICIPVSRLCAWLFSISASKVKPELQDALRAYQTEAADVLDRHFRLRKETITAEHEATIARMDGMIDALQGHLLARHPRWAKLVSLQKAGMWRTPAIDIVRGSRSFRHMLEEVNEMVRCGLVPDGDWFPDEPRTRWEREDRMVSEITALKIRLEMLAKDSAALKAALPAAATATQAAPAQQVAAATEG